MKKEKIIRQFEELQQIHKILGNVYEARAYENVVKALEDYPKAEIGKAVELKGVPNIGAGTLAKVEEILRTGGKISLLEELKNDPKIRTRLELQRIIGIGPKQAKTLVENRGVKSVADLKRRWKSGNITLTRMQEIGLRYYKELNQRIPRHEIADFGEKLTRLLKPLGFEVILAGSFRRGKSTSGDIDVILVNPAEIRTERNLQQKQHFLEEVIEVLQKHRILIEIISTNQGGFSAVIRTGKEKGKIRQMDLKIAPSDLLPFFLLYFGSGVRFSRQIRQKAKEQGMKLSEWGLNGMRKAKNEREIFQRLGIPYVPPEKR